MTAGDTRWHEEKGLTISASRPPLPGGGPQTIATMLEPMLRTRPEAAALVGRHGRYNYRELDAAVTRAAAALHGLGLRAPDRIAACLPNDVDIVIAFLASQRLGLIWVGVNRPLAPAEKTYILRDCGARAYLVSADSLSEVADRRDETPDLEHVLSVDPDSPDCEWRRVLAAADESTLPEIEIDPFVASAIAYTSGTTGFPKGAVHSQHNLLLPGVVAAIRKNRPRPDQHGVVLPMTILNLIVLGPLCVLHDGRCLVAMDRIDALGVAEWVRQEQIGAFDGVPTIIHDLLTHPDVTKEDLASLTAPGMGGADSPPEVVQLFRERFGGEVIIGYGMTEAPTAVTWTDGSIPKGPGLCGRPIPQVEIEILGERGEVLPSGEIGEICVRPTREGEFAGVYTPMLGYWGKASASEEALADGRYHTGDLGFLEDDGNLYIRGRRNELILRGGANVYPAEIERVLGLHPEIAAAAVLGIPDARLGERVAAVVQRRPDSTLDEDALKAYVGKELARYKVPEFVRFVDDMPRNAMNKIVKPKLKPLFD
ncbi:MAG: AMP-binding protein [bacterium]|nr:AMP-dependent synthetase [Deltaproteobacteria bacterium]MCP4903836.1 AMP-binding protein [bacterium]